MAKLYFLTSSPVKMNHAKHIARGLDVIIRKQDYYGAAYFEPRIEERESLLQDSLKDAIRRMAGVPQEQSEEPEQALFKKDRFNELTYDSFFFIEDSSVIIHALSQPKKEFPGTDVKYWMKETSYAELDAALKTKGNDRSVTVRSDVCLHIPEPERLKLGLNESYIRFTGESTGTISDREHEFQTNPVFPWLDNKTFNKWFVPDGFDTPISMLPIEQADRVDFRCKSIGSMFVWLQTNNLIHAKGKSAPKHAKQEFFPFVANNLFLVSGYPCSGKTTIGEHLSVNNGFHHIEASDFMRHAYHQHHGYTSAVPLEKFATELLKAYPETVVEGVLSEIKKSDRTNIVVTGFRAAEESVLFMAQYDGSCDVDTVFLSADAKARFERSQKRDREDALSTLDEFTRRDSIQEKMGLRAIADKYTSIIENNTSIESFCRKFETSFELENQPFDPEQAKRINYFQQSLEGRILLFFLIDELKSNERNEYTTTEISHGINRFFTANKFDTEKDNVSRYFNFKSHPYFRAHPIENVVKFSLSATGRSRAIHLARIEFNR